MTSTAKKILLRLGIALLILGLLTAFEIWENKSVGITEIEYKNPKIPAGFDGFRIVQLSDIHSYVISTDHTYFLGRVRQSQPDIIVITGDLHDTVKKDYFLTMNLVYGLVEIAPVYFVTGNHECWLGPWEPCMKYLREAGVTLCDDRCVRLTRGGGAIDMIGVYDPEYLRIALRDAKGYYTHLRDTRNKAKTDFVILLSHRPELFERYVNQGVDLVFTGHAHGGQARIPRLRGFWAPDQGFFPRYTEGVYKKGKTSMVVSRGLGNNTSVKFRLFNRPEIVAVTLRAK
ncbi:MAG: metallophosphoesterase [Abditibacteriota bacterium]|nr:metallophosphoesterase [Abditibacteriota bacterium]